MIEWTEAKSHERYYGEKRKWMGNGQHFDFVVRQYKTASTVDVQFTKIRGDGVRLSNERRIGQFVTLKEAQQYAEQYDEQEDNGN